MADDQELFDALCAPFPTEAIDWRIGSTTKDKSRGMALAYVDARAVMDRLDSVAGPQFWQCNYTPIGPTSIVCNLGIAFNNAWVWKADGAGETDYEAQKGMLSDAFKRAAVRFGVGRYLYDLPSPWVAIDEHKRIAEGERKKLDELHDKEASKALWGARAGVQAYRLLLRSVQEFVTQASDVSEFRAKNNGMIAQLPVAMRQHLERELDRIGAGGSTEKAADVKSPPDGPPRAGDRARVASAAPKSALHASLLASLALEDPEKFLKEADTRMQNAKSVDELSTLYNDTLEPAAEAGKMFPPDMSAMVKLFEHHERRLAE